MSGQLIDIPYSKSPPVIFTYRQTANLALGVYNFGGSGASVTKSVFTPSRPIMPNTLYMFETVSFSMDADQNDYQGAIQILPTFSAYMQSDASGPLFREPMSLDKYFENYPYRLAVMSSSGVNAAQGAAGDTFNKLFGSVSGVVQQTAALIGRANLSAIVKMTAQEISDKDFVRQFQRMGQERNAPSGRQF